MAKAMFGAGCFWGVEAAFRKMPGVTKTAVGYSGGATRSPSYEDVCSGRTGHAEIVYLEYDPEKVSYGELLDLLWSIHDPTTANRQGPDVGTQYRSAIYFYDKEQEATAEASKKALGESGKFSRDIVTEITPAGEFWIAEDYHQQYFEKNKSRFFMGH